MKSSHTVLNYQTKGCLEIIDLTDRIIEHVGGSGVKNGLVNVQTLHTTTGLFLNENEPLFWQDLREHIEEVASRKKEYGHDDFDRRTVNVCDGECANGHSHCKAIHFSANLTLNLIDAKLQLGTWQRILFIELDRARPRQIQVLIIGE
ncbi:MAG: secondary thiamine-phosphate synthase enzyme YjbQ [Candidatus Liptonbacteria bacterium]